MYILSRVINYLKSKIIYVISVLHAFWLIIFTFIWLNQSFTYGDELFMMQAISGITHQIFNIGQKPNTKDFLFVNIAYDRTLVPKFDENRMEIGRQDITNRDNLAKFFHILNQKPDNHRFVLCDVYFGKSCPEDDKNLAAELKQMKNILIPYHKTAEGRWKLPTEIFDRVPRGVADYITADTKGTFLKFTFMESEIHRSIPLIMYEKLHKAEYQKKAFLYFMNGSLSLNSVILNLRIQNDDLHENEDYRRFYINMETLLQFPDVLLGLVKDRIVVIGDFEERDIHETVFGNMAGPLVLVNAYLSLVNGDNILSFLFLMTLFVFYLLISYRIFSDRPFGIWNYLKKPFFKLTATVEHILLLKNVGAYLKKKNTRVLISSIAAAVGFCLFLYFYFDIPLNLSFIPLYLIIAWIIEIEFITMLTSYFAIAILFSVISYLVFQISVNILFIAAYLTMTEKFVKYLRQKR